MKKKQILKKFLLLILVFSLLGSGIAIIGFKGFAGSTVTHRFTISPSGSGKVVGGQSINCPSKCSFTYNYNTSPISHKATPAAGYEFVGWENTPSVRAGYDYSQNPLSISRKTSWNFKAVFKKKVTPVVAAPTPTPQPAPEPVVTETESTVDEQPQLEAMTSDTYVEPESAPESNLEETSGEIALGGDIAASDELTEDKTPPTIPKALKGDYNVEKSSVLLTWEQSIDDSGAVSYEIERTIKGASDWVNLSTEENTEYSDNDFDPEKSYSYRVRAKDGSENVSDYSNIYDVQTGTIKPNVIAGEAVTITSDDKYVGIYFPANSTTEDLTVVIEKINAKEIVLEKERKLASGGYSIKIRRQNGEEVNDFKTQLKLSIKTVDIGNSVLATAKMGYITEGDTNITYVKSAINTKTKTVSILTNHFSSYFVTVEKTSGSTIFLRIILWIVIIGGLGALGYFGYQYLERKKYQKQHSEDYIYRR